MRADLALGEAHTVAVKRAHDLARLGFNFVFFAADEWNDVAQHVYRGMPRIASARKRLHCDHNYALHAERSINRSKRHHKSHSRAVRIGHNRARPRAPLALSL